MYTPVSASHAHELATPHSGGIRWDGHMCDDVAATAGIEPMAFLSATREELLLCGNRGTYRFARTDIVRLGRGKMYPWLFRAIRIYHNVPRFPRDLQFKPMHAKWPDVLRALELLGYPVA